ncbi:MAG: NnrS family protein, partial [Pseudomonadota bacterium]
DGFRPFFLFAALWAVISMIVWIFILSNYLVLPSRFDPVSWHAHEFLFGYLGAVIAGFLLTAVPNWTGRPPVKRIPLITLFTLWVAGRFAVAFSFHLPVSIVIAVDLSMPLLLIVLVARELIISRNFRNLAIVLINKVLVFGNLIFHLEVNAGEYAASGLGQRIGLGAIIILISIIGGRIVPAFTRNWIIKQGGDKLPPKSSGYDAFALVFMVMVLLCWVVLPISQISGYLLLSAAFVHFFRLARWKGYLATGEPLIWVMHVGYFFIPLGSLVLGLSVLNPDFVDAVIAQHLWMTGGISVMTLAVMTRATLGHTGRKLKADFATTFIFLAAILSVIFRFLTGFNTFDEYFLIHASGVLWISGFLTFAFVYGQKILAPSLDEQPCPG